MPTEPLPLHVHLRRHAAAQPDEPFFVWYGASVSYAEMDRASDAFAAEPAGRGVGKGDPVALYLGHCPQYAIAHFGIQKLGAIVCPCGPLFKGARARLPARRPRREGDRRGRRPAADSSAASRK